MHNPQMKRETAKGQKGDSLMAGVKSDRSNVGI